MPVGQAVHFYALIGDDAIPVARHSTHALPELTLNAARSCRLTCFEQKHTVGLGSKEIDKYQMSSLGLAASAQSHFLFSGSLSVLPSVKRRSLSLAATSM